MNQNSNWKHAMKNRSFAPIVALLASLPAAVLLTAATIGSVVPVSIAQASANHCKWEGGPGAGTYAECLIEDCVGRGGLAQCSAGGPKVGTPYTDPQVTDDKWAYHAVDSFPSHPANTALWCTVSGGTWYVPGVNPQCIDLPAGMLGLAATNNEGDIVSISDAWVVQKFSNCSTSLVSDTQWGTPVHEDLGIPIWYERMRSYTADCSGTNSGVDITFLKFRAAECEANYIPRTAVTGPECYLPAECCLLMANPVSVLTGAKLHKDNDYIVSALTGIEFSRYYKSSGYYWPDYLISLNPTGDPRMSDFWRHTYDRRLLVITSNTEIMAIVQRPDGSLQIFNTSGAEIGKRNGTNGGGAHFQAVTGGWDLTLANSDVEHYNGLRRLTSITTRGGQVTTLSYNGAGNLQTVTGPFGHTLTFAYDSDDLLESITLPDDGAITYGYDDDKRLTSVTYADGETKHYSYGDVHNGWLLTGIVDESGATFGTYEYDASGRVTDEEHAGGVESYSFAYGTLGQPTTVTDPLGTATSVGFAGAGGLYRRGVTSQACMVCGSAASTTYDSRGNPATSSDFNGSQTTYTFDSTRNLETSRTEANGTPRARTISTQWHSTFRLPTQVDEPGRRTAYSYDSGGNVLTRTVTDLSTSASRTWTSTYTGLGQVSSVDGPRSDVADTAAFTYSSCTTGGACGQLLTATDAAGNTTTYSSYDDNGLPLTITDANGTVTTLVYDERQRVTSRTVGGETTAYEYWPTGLLKKVTLPDDSLVAYEYDGAHRLTKVTDSGGNYIVYTLDGAGNRIAEEVFDSEDTLVLSKTRSFNGLGRLEEEVGSDEQTVSHVYDPNGNVVSTLDAMGRLTQYGYDELDRLSAIYNPMLQTTQLSYSARDDLLSVLDPRSLSTSYTYNGFGDATALTSPDTGSSTTTRDAAGNVSVATDSRSKAGEYTYDALDRVSAIGYADQTIELTYDLGTNGAGHLTEIEDGSGHTVWTYDALGRVESRTQTTAAVELDVGYEYDADGHLESLTTPSGQVIGFSYASGRVDGVTVNSANLIYGVAYEPFGPTRGWHWGDGDTTARQYDTDGQLVSIASAGTSTYTYFPDGMIKSRADDFSASLPSTTGSTAFTVASSSNRITAASGLLTRSYSYDAAGNTTGDGTRTFTYDDSGRMKTSTAGGVTTTYKYNGLGERVKKTNSTATTYFAYDEAGHLIGEYDDEGDLIQETVWFQDMPIATLRPNGASGVDIYYVHTDHLNTPRRITDPSDDDAIIWRWDSEPYGSTAANEDPDEDLTEFTYNLRFPGQYLDDETELHYNYFRDYDAVTGRYIESDPIGLDGGVNTYAYVQGNPISLVDPLGLQSRTAPRPYYPGPFDPFTPGTPAYNHLVDLGTQALDDLVDKVKDLVCPPDDNEFCHTRYEQEFARCFQWSRLGGRVVAACQERAADRRTLCIRNGGRPNPEEPPEYNPFVDYPR